MRGRRPIYPRCTGIIAMYWYTTGTTTTGAVYSLILKGFSVPRATLAFALLVYDITYYGKLGHDGTQDELVPKLILPTLTPSPNPNPISVFSVCMFPRL